jgi:PAS domain-containing protein
MNVTRDGVFMFEARLRFFFVNDGAVQLVGYTRKELLGDDLCGPQAGV